MSEWVKRAIVPEAASAYSDIWDGDGWQINKKADPDETPYLVIDAVMPCSVPASGVYKRFKTLGEAQEWADNQGRPDWSDWIAEYGED